MKKKILLIMTSHFSINEMLIANLEKIGYEVTYIDVDYVFKYKNLKQRVTNFTRKTFLADRNYKNLLRKKSMESTILYRLNQYSTHYFDFALVIRPDHISVCVIKRINEVCKKSFAYQWDGMKRFHTPNELIREFDVFALFDYQDYEEYKKKFDNIILTDNFYFDFLQKSTDKNIDLVYFGSYQEDRFNTLDKLLRRVEPLHLKIYFHLSKEKKKEQTKVQNKITITSEHLKYKQIASISRNAKAVLDLKYPFHNGLSLRIFEALYFDQKVISNNQTIKKYDFYNENNFLIFDTIQDLNEKDLQNFLSKPYIEILDEIKEKYSFTSWVHHLLEA